MNFKDLEAYFENLLDRILKGAAEIVAETAVEYFKETFGSKGYDGVPWLPLVVNRFQINQ